MDPDTFIRMVPSLTTPAGIGFILDKEKQGDKIIKGENGEKPLLLGKDIAAILPGMVLDYKDMGNKSMQFTITGIQYRYGFQNRNNSLKNCVNLLLPIVPRFS
jgi:hypothetical protein